MTYSEIKQIRNLKIALKDLEPCFRSADSLLRGRAFPNFKMLPREACANWLLAATLSNMLKREIIFGESPVGDGIIVDKISGQLFITEHVSGLENEFNPLPKGEARAILAIDKKIARGFDYAKKKRLVVFFDGAEEWYRNKIREDIKGRHNFDSVYCIGLLGIVNEEYSYSVTEFKESYGDQSWTFRVDIKPEFTTWQINQIMA